MEHDQNGNLCALIKVENTLNGFSFNVGSLGVTAVRRVGGEIWVYVPFGVKRITISHPQLGVLRDYPFPCPIERGRTYIMKLTSGSVRTIIEETPTKQFLHITLNPADAILEINGKIKATHNGVYQELMPFGQYEYRAYCHDYHEKSGIIKISDPENTHKLRIDLTAAFGNVSISSRLQPDIEGAAVYIDDRYIGQIPVSNVRINSGTHRLRVIKELYEAYYETFTLNDGESLQLTPNMQGDFATVTLMTDNTADIYVNGEFKARGLWKGKLTYGSYVFESRQEGHIPFKWSYDVTSNDGNKTIHIQGPTPIYGSLAISSTPSEAKIRINGEYIGETPKLITKQVIGDYTIECELDGYTTQTKAVKVSEGTESTVSFIMAAKPAAQKITGQFKDVTIEHNVMKDGVKGMKILADFSVQNMKGIDGSCAVYFYYENGTPVKDKNQSHRTSDGNAATHTDIKPGYDNTSYTDLEIFMPNNEIEVAVGKHNLKFFCSIWENSTGSSKLVASSEYYYFTISKD